MAVFRHLVDKDTISGHTGVLQFGKTAWLPIRNGTGITETAAAHADHQPRLSCLIDQLTGQFVMPGLGRLDLLIIIQRIVDIPHGLHHQCLSSVQDLFTHFFHSPAVRRAGIVDAVFSSHKVRKLGTNTRFSVSITAASEKPRSSASLISSFPFIGDLSILSDISLIYVYVAYWSVKSSQIKR